MFIDSHCHIYYDTYAKDISDIINRAFDAGVEKLICIGVDIESSKECINLANKFTNIYATIGFHPHESKLAPNNYLNILETMSSDPKVVGIGEIGLDFHYNHSNKEIQQKVFTEQLELAKSLNLPTVIHSRNSDNEIIEIIKKTKSNKGVLHCFASNLNQANKIIELGYYISFTGLITFVSELKSVIKNISINKILIETDSPYLAPIPYRGKRNEPSYILEIAKKIAEVKNISLSEVEKVTQNNTLTLFSKIK